MDNSISRSREISNLPQTAFAPGYGRAEESVNFDIASLENTAESQNNSVEQPTPNFIGSREPLGSKSFYKTGIVTNPLIKVNYSGYQSPEVTKAKLSPSTSHLIISPNKKLGQSASRLRSGTNRINQSMKINIVGTHSKK